MKTSHLKSTPMNRFVPPWVCGQQMVCCVALDQGSQQSAAELGELLSCSGAMLNWIDSSTLAVFWDASHLKEQSAREIAVALERTRDFLLRQGASCGAIAVCMEKGLDGAHALTVASELAFYALLRRMEMLLSAGAYAELQSKLKAQEVGSFEYHKPGLNSFSVFKALFPEPDGSAGAPEESVIEHWVDRSYAPVAAPGYDQEGVLQIEQPSVTRTAAPRQYRAR